MADTTKKIIRGVVNSRGFTITSPITQWDYGWQFIPEIEDLPATYRLDFSNEEKHGTALPVYCSTDGAEVPTELIDTGKDVWVWLFNIGEGYGITEYKWRIPNKCKPKTEEDEPTPTQQSSIDQAISVVNDAVERAEDAQEAIENMSVSATTLAEGSTATVTKTESEGVVHLTFGIPKGQTGDTPTITASKTGKTTSIYVDGSEVAQIEDGTDGTNGDDGYSPTANVSKSGKTTTITITDKNGTTSAQVEDGTDGTDGISPTVTITPITGGHRITITDADGEHSADVMDGTGEVDDVQINGTSIVNDGVANVPTASASRLGVIKTSNANGIYVNSNGDLSISEASSANVKTGTNVYKPITPHIEHEATFYGLAKSAGDTTQSASSNTVGNYTEEAKSAIAEMLGLPYERLIYRDDTFGNVWSERQVTAFDVENNTVTLDDVTGIPTDEVSATRFAYIVYKPILNLQYGNLPTELLTFGRIKCIGDNKIQFYKDDGTTLVTFTDTGCLDASKCRILIYTGASQSIPQVDNLLSNHKYHVRFTYYGLLPDSSGIFVNTRTSGTGYGQSDAKRRDVMLFINKNNSVVVPGQYDAYSCIAGNRVLVNGNYLTPQMNATFGQFDIWIEPYGALNGCKYSTELVTMCANTTNKTEWMYPKFAVSRGLMNEPVSTIGMTINNVLDKFANGCKFEVWDCGTHF